MWHSSHRVDLGLRLEKSGGDEGPRVIFEDARLSILEEVKTAGSRCVFATIAHIPKG